MNKDRAPAAPSLLSVPLSVRDTATFRLLVLADLTGRLSDLFFEREFNLRTTECRVLGAVDAFQPVTLRRACAEIELEKSQGSRIVARLQEAGWIERRDDPADQRSFFLLLTPAGRDLHERMKKAALKWNEQWLAGMPPELETAFRQAVEWQIRHVRELLGNQNGGERTAPSVPVASASAEARPLLVERESLEELHRHIGELLGVRTEGAPVAKGREALRAKAVSVAPTKPRGRKSLGARRQAA